MRLTASKHRSKSRKTLGGAASYFALAASQFTPVRLVGIVGDDFTEKDKTIFKNRRIDLTGLEHAAGKTFFWAGRYSQNMNERTTLVTDLNVFANFKPTLPPAYKDSSFIFLAISIRRCNGRCCNRCRASRRSSAWIR